MLPLSTFQVLLLGRQCAACTRRYYIPKVEPPSNFVTEEQFEQLWRWLPAHVRRTHACMVHAHAPAFMHAGMHWHRVLWYSESMRIAGIELCARAIA